MSELMKRKFCNRWITVQFLTLYLTVAAATRTDEPLRRNRLAKLARLEMCCCSSIEICNKLSLFRM